MREAISMQLEAIGMQSEAISILSRTYLMREAIRGN